jgi:hypothetical protein
VNMELIVSAGKLAVENMELKKKLDKHTEQWYTFIMPNSKQRITNRKHKRSHELRKRKRAASLMNAKVGTLRELDRINQLPKSVKQERLPNG